MRRLAKIDMNLLVVFSTLMQDLSVSRAAERLFVGQPAVSASLKRLRVLFSDPLLVKVGRQMVATERALQLRGQVDAVLAAVDGFAFATSSFDPASAHVTLRLGLSDDNEIVFLPSIVRELRRLAPAVRVVTRPVNHLNIRDSLDAGDVDVGISVFGKLSPWHSSVFLYDQGYGCLFDPQRHKRRRTLRLADYLTARQAIVTFDGEMAGKIDTVLAERDLRRRVSFGTTRFSTLPHLIKGTDLVASLPELVGRVLAASHGLAYCKLPFDVPDGRPQMAWHRRNDVDPASCWLRSLIEAEVQKTVAELT